MADNSCMKPTAYLVITTVPDEERAQHLALMAVERGFAACAQVQSPCQSFYWWDDKVQQDQEFPVHLKTNADKLAVLEEFIKNHHPYDVPQIIAIAIDHLENQYGNWLKEELKKH